MTLYTSTRRAVELAENVKRQFGDESGVQITDQDLLRWVNDGIRELSVKLRPLKGKATAATVAGQGNYAIPNGAAIQIESIHINNRKIEGVSFAQAEEQMGASSELTGSPSFWYEWGGEITFWPAPSEISSMTIFYTRMPDQITDMDAVLPVPDKHYESIVAFVLSKAYELDEQFDASNMQRNLFLTRIGEQADEELTGQTLTYPSITIVED